MDGLMDRWANGWMGGCRWRKHLWPAMCDVPGVALEANSVAISWSLPFLPFLTFHLTNVRTHVTPTTVSAPPRKSLANQHSKRKKGLSGSDVDLSSRGSPREDVKKSAESRVWWNEQSYTE